MSVEDDLGTVASLWRFPVKSMGGEMVKEVHVSPGGLLGDRTHALVDRETGKVVSAKSVRSFPGVLSCKAAFVEPPSPGRELPAVRILLPDGRSILSDSGDADRALSSHFRREVTLARAAPESFTIDMYNPDVEGAVPAGQRGTFVEQKLGAAYFQDAGLTSPVPQGAFFDLFPVSLLTTSTLDRLTELEPGSRFDPRRFRMNVIIGTAARGFVENGWIGKRISVGGQVRLRVAKHDARCVMTTLEQGDLGQDTGILKALVRHNRVGLSPCAGVYAEVETGGTVRTGDPVISS